MSASERENVDLERAADLSRRFLPRLDSEQARARALRHLRDGVVDVPRHGDVAVTDDMDLEAWTDTADRARGRYIHGFIFLRDLASLMGPESTEGPAAARFALKLLQAWEDRHPTTGASTPSHPMAFHDETTAQRMLHVLAVVDELSALGAKETTWVRGFLDRTADLLATSEFHAGLNNHGMFQDLALFSWSCLAVWRDRPVRVDYLLKANKRLLKYFRHAFTQEGVHVENAPNYHVLIARHLKQHHELARAARLQHIDELAVTLRRAAVYATHAVRPDGTFPPVSDTQPTHLATVAREVFGDEEFLYAATAGERGSQPSRRVLVLPKSGYAIYRSAWGDRDATYVYFSAAYNSDYHKHSDENSLYVRSGGVDLISEAGPYGYNYSDPFTKYGYSQFAHSTVLVNGRSTPRTDDRAAEVSMRVSEVRDSGLSVVGRNGRLDGAVHERSVEVCEVEGRTHIDVVDAMWASELQVYDILWNVGRGVIPVLQDGGFVLLHNDVELMNARISSAVPFDVTLHSEEKSPDYLGWRFPAFGRVEPGVVVRVRLAARDANVTTCLKLLAPTRVSTSPLVVASSVSGAAVSAKVLSPSGLQYAYRIFRGWEQVDEIPYSGRTAATWQGLAPGRYRVRVYARPHAGVAPVAQTTSPVVVPNAV